MQLKSLPESASTPATKTPPTDPATQTATPPQAESQNPSERIITDPVEFMQKMGYID
jgi:hypothetical protein